MRRRNITAALVLLAIGAGYGLLTSQLPTRSLPDTPGPPFFPWINTTVILVLSTIPFFAALMVLFGEARPLRVSTGSILSTAFLYLLFRHGFGVFLPTGLLKGLVP